MGSRWLETGSLEGKTVGKMVGTLVLGVWIILSQIAQGATWYVDGRVSVSGDGKSWESPFKRIQQGIGAAANGDTILVAEGVYVENIYFGGKNIRLTSTAPLNPTVVANTVIDGNRGGSVVTFSGTENETCVLSGFTIMNGDETWPSGGPGGIEGGFAEQHTHSAITNNRIMNNRGSAGGGLSGCDGLIQNNTITGNHAEEAGGGLFFCNGTIQNNLIYRNYCYQEGGACTTAAARSRTTRFATIRRV